MTAYSPGRMVDLLLSELMTAYSPGPMVDLLLSELMTAYSPVPMVTRSEEQMCRSVDYAP